MQSNIICWGAAVVKTQQPILGVIFVAISETHCLKTNFNVKKWHFSQYWYVLRISRRPNQFLWLVEGQNFSKKFRKKSLSSCYGYIDLIEVKTFAARERGLLSLRDQQCSSSVDFQKILENYKDRDQSTSIWHKIGNFKISINFFIVQWCQTWFNLTILTLRGIFKDIWHNYTHFKYWIGIILCLFWYIVSNYLKWRF